MLRVQAREEGHRASLDSEGIRARLADPLNGRLEPPQTLFPGQRPGLDQPPFQHVHWPRAEPGSLEGGRRGGAQVKPRKCERGRMGIWSSG